MCGGWNSLLNYELTREERMWAMTTNLDTKQYATGILLTRTGSGMQ
jgi:hypothetical protein